MVEDRYSRLRGDVDQLQTDMQGVRMSLAVREENFKNTSARLEKIEAMLSRVTWLIIGGIVSGAVAFIIAGGLRVPPVA